MRRILFVDDEPMVLAGIRNLLRRQRREWDMVFVEGGQAALDEMQKEAFDIVVSDMRMPEIDGAELLKRVKVSHAGTTRIVLSGHAEPSAVMRALPVAHQFLSKPCDADSLRGTLARALQLRNLLANDALRRLVGQLDRLPSPSETYFELTAALEQASSEKVADIASRDPAMATKLLQVVNSAFFGNARPLTSIAEAVRALGDETVRGLALTAQVFGSVADQPCASGFSLSKWQQRSVEIARRVQAQLSNPALAQTAFTAGLLHDVGEVVLAFGMPDAYAEVVASAPGTSVHEAERRVFGVSHAEIGAYLVGIWGLPLVVVNAVAHHHEPERAPEEFRELAQAVHDAHV